MWFQRLMMINAEWKGKRQALTVLPYENISTCNLLLKGNYISIFQPLSTQDPISCLQLRLSFSLFAKLVIHNSGFISYWKKPKTTHLFLSMYLGKRNTAMTVPPYTFAFTMNLQNKVSKCLRRTKRLDFFSWTVWKLLSSESQCQL